MADMKASEILKAGLELLGPNGEHWTQRAYARKANGDDTMDITEATCFCGLGCIRAVVAQRNEVTSLYAMARFSDENVDVCAGEYLHRAVPHINGMKSWAPWQDQTHITFPEVKEKYLQAIALAETHEAAKCAQVAA